MFPLYIRFDVISILIEGVFTLKKCFKNKLKVLTNGLQTYAVNPNPSIMQNYIVESTQIFRTVKQQCIWGRSLQHGVRGKLLEGLPQLSLGKKAALDREMTLVEFTAAVNQMASTRD